VLRYLLFLTLAAALGTGCARRADPLAGGRKPSAPGAAPQSQAPAAGALAVSLIDVGQGDSILVQFPDGETMLVDAGDQAHGQDVVRYLRQRGCSRIDILVGTHPHADHIGGMAAVLAAFPVGKVWDSGFVQASRVQQEYLATITRKGIQFGKPRRGFTQDIGNVRVEVLAPARLLRGTDSDANNNGLVLRVSHGKVSFLLMGDAEGRERATVPNWPASTVLKVAHHGSRNGTTAAFLRAVKPELALISCAAHNDYGHPHAETLAALRSAGAKIRNTAADGTIVVTTTGEGYSVSPPSAGTASVAPRQPAASGDGQVIGNRSSKAFHRPTCVSLPQPQNRVTFANRDEAVSRGYHPCSRCNP
jgi:competence protein ComEC